MGKLTLTNLTKKYGNNTVVDNVSLQVENGELLTIVGPSGCGKTTILRMIAGLCMPSGGSIMLDDEEFFNGDSTKHPIEPENRDIGMVFQSYAVWPHMNAFDNVAYPLKLRKIKKSDIASQVSRVFDVVHLTGYEKRMAHEMSGGQQQRVALARALVMNPRLLLLDEPLSNLDAALRDEMRGEIKEIQRTLNITIINVTHDQIEAMTMSDKVAVMNMGHLVQLGSPNELYEHPANTFVARFIGSANVLPATCDKDAKPTSDGMMRVMVMGKYPVDVPYVKATNKQGFIAARAHHILPDDASPCSGIIRRKLYQGVQNEYHIDLGDGKLHRFTTPVSYDRNVGDKAGIRIEKALWLDE